MDSIFINTQHETRIDVRLFEPHRSVTNVTALYEVFKIKIIRFKI